MWRERVLDHRLDRSDVVSRPREHLVSTAECPNALNECVASIDQRGRVSKGLIRDCIDDGEHVLNSMRELGIDQPGALLGSHFARGLDDSVEEACNLTCVVADGAVAERKIRLFWNAGAMHDQGKVF